MRIMANGRECLVRWEKLFNKLYPEDDHDIATERHLTFINVARAANTNNACNQAHK